MVAYFFQYRFRRINTARVKILLVLLALNLLLMLVFTMLIQWVMSTEVRRDADNRLAVAVQTLPMLLPPDYLHRAMAGAAVSSAEYLSIAARLNQYCQIAGIRYLYAFRLVDGHVSYMLDSAPPAELAADRYGHYQAKYQDDDGLVMAALLDGQARKGTRAR
jgi:hypothetical protein